MADYDETCETGRYASFHEFPSEEEENEYLEEVAHVKEMKKNFLEIKLIGDAADFSESIKDIALETSTIGFDRSDLVLKLVNFLKKYNSIEKDESSNSNN